jgi:hypothetical protein
MRLTQKRWLEAAFVATDGSLPGGGGGGGRGGGGGFGTPAARDPVPIIERGHCCQRRGRVG